MQKKVTRKAAPKRAVSKAAAKPSGNKSVKFKIVSKVKMGPYGNAAIANSVRASIKGSEHDAKLSANAGGKNKVTFFATVEHVKAYPPGMTKDVILGVMRRDHPDVHCTVSKVM